MNKWFIGDFKPHIIKTDEIEIGFKKFKAREQEEPHFHKIATEITVIVEGKVKMNNEIFKENEIIIMEPNEIGKFEVLEDSKLLVSLQK